MIAMRIAQKLALALLTGAALVTGSSLWAADLSPAQAQAIAAEAYIYTDPLVTMDPLRHGGTTAKVTADGGLTIYIQSTSPSRDKESNWLPSSTSGAFHLVMRTYMPGAEIVEQNWAPPPVTVTAIGAPQRATTQRE